MTSGISDCDASPLRMGERLAIGGVLHSILRKIPRPKLDFPEFERGGFSFNPAGGLFVGMAACDSRLD